MGTYFAQVSEVISQADVPNGELQSLVLNCLYTLAEAKLPIRLVKAVFELRVACIAGYTPDLDSCLCQTVSHPSFFDLSGGILMCDNCKKHNVGIRHPVSNGTLDAMRYIISCDPKRMFSFVLGEDSLMQLSSITEAYLVTQLERGFSTLDFFKSLLI